MPKPTYAELVATHTDAVKTYEQAAQGHRHARAAYAQAENTAWAAARTGELLRDATGAAEDGRTADSLRLLRAAELEAKTARWRARLAAECAKTARAFGQNDAADAVERESAMANAAAQAVEDTAAATRRNNDTVEPPTAKAPRGTILGRPIR